MTTDYNSIARDLRLRGLEEAAEAIESLLGQNYELQEELYTLRSRADRKAQKSDADVKHEIAARAYFDRRRIKPR